MLNCIYIIYIIYYVCVFVQKRSVVFYDVYVISSSQSRKEHIRLEMEFEVQNSW